MKNVEIREYMASP